MVERTVTIINPLGLHARAAAKLVQLTGTFRSSVSLQKAEGGVSADARSILSLLYVAAGKGSIVRIIVDGPDEAEAAEAIESLFSSGFYEI